MNVLELADYWLERKLVIDMAEETANTLLQQDYEIQDLAEWKRSLMEVNRHQAEIAALKARPDYDLKAVNGTH